MSPDKRSALIDCISNLKDALDSLDIVDDDDFNIATHWAIKDVIDDIEIELEAE
jgi:hypothetical protein